MGGKLYERALYSAVADIVRFQMVSLLKLAKVTEEGVRFLSPHDGTPMFVYTSHSSIGRAH